MAMTSDKLLTLPPGSAGLAIAQATPITPLITVILTDAEQAPLDAERVECLKSIECCMIEYPYHHLD